MSWVGTPYFLVVLSQVLTISVISLVIRVVWHMNKYLIFIFLGFPDSW
jgi:hypothetical protein